MSRPPAAPVTRVALYGYLGSGNFGNDASFETVLGWLRAAHPGVDVRCITIAPESVRARYGVPSVPLSAYQARAGTPRPVAVAGKLIGRLRDVPRSLTLAGSVDAVVVPGMGVLEESLGVRPWGLPSWLFLTALACRLRRRRFVLLDVGAEPVTDPITRRLFVATVRLAHHVSYRDAWSAEAMRGAGAREPDAVAPDLAFAHPEPIAVDPEPGRVVVGVMAYYGPSDHPVRGARVRRDYVTALTRALLPLLDDGDRLVLLGGDRVDTDVARQLEGELRAARPGLAGDAVRVSPASTFAQVSREMARAELVIASRFHNLIAALRLGRPIVSLGYAAKSQELVNRLGLDGYHQRIDDLDAGRLVDQLRAARARSSELSALIARGSDGYLSEVMALLDRVGDEVLGLPSAQGEAVG